MNEYRQLLQLQQVDTELCDKQASLQRILDQSEKNEELDTSRLALEQAKQKLDELTKSHQSLDWESRDLDEKMKQGNRQLFAGKTVNPKELLALQKDVDSMKARRKVLEDKLLEVMVEVDATQAEVKTAQATVDNIEKQWQKQKTEMEVQRGELKAVIDQLTAKRAAAASQLTPPTLERYESVKTIRGQAVARVERGMCQGCRLILPVGEWQRVRSGAIVQCSSCGRLLCTG